MRKIVEEGRPFTRYDLAPDAGKEKLEAEGNKYKLDNAGTRQVAGGQLSFYVTGTDPSGHPIPAIAHWEDLCRGPHVDRTSRIGAFKITSIATSHWHGDVKSDRFQRVYGTAFFTQADLDDTSKSSSRPGSAITASSGASSGLFEIDDAVGQGLILWKPKGAVVRQELQSFIGSNTSKSRAIRRSSRRTSASSGCTARPATSRTTRTRSSRRSLTASR